MSNYVKRIKKNRNFIAGIEDIMNSVYIYADECIHLHLFFFRNTKITVNEYRIIKYIFLDVTRHFQF